MRKLFIVLLLLPVFSIAQNAERILTLTQFHIKQGHSAQFEDGVKKYIECYQGDDGQESWNFWKRVQGTGTVYGVSSYMDNWAKMDEKDPAGQSCYAIVTNFIMPHIESMSYDITKTMPDWSRSTPPAEQTKIIWVTHFDVKDNQAFRYVMEQVNGVMKSKEGDVRGYWYNIMGGQDSGDYLVSTPYSSYAELDVQKDSPYKMFVNAKGEKKAKEMGNIWYKAVNDSWSYIWEHKPEMSN